MQIIKKTSINFIRFRLIAAIFSMVLISCGIASLIINGGPRLSIDFTGGTIVQVQFKETISIPEVRKKIMEYGFSSAEIVEFGNPKEIIIKTQTTGPNSEISKNLSSALLNEEFLIRRIESVGPKIGGELQRDSLVAIGLALMMILLYISFRFDAYYAIGSVVALIHDIAITLGIFSLLSYEINLSIIAAFLTIVGYSLNDTIVVYDRIRENVPKNLKKSLSEIVNISINETLSRTLITSITTMMVVITLYIFGGEVIGLFAYALIVGVFIGTYSSIFVASPIMLYFEDKLVNKIQK